MRDIKFRAWYNQTNEMINWNEIQECVRNIDWDDFMADFELMQYTGLKDNNGVEIYEGDIVTDGMSNALIVCDNGCFYIEWQNLKSICSSGRGYLFREINNVEAIGNIHENPDLLTAGDRT